VARTSEDALASAEGGYARVGGQRLRDGIFDRRSYVAPTVVDVVPLDRPLFKEEMFLPFTVMAPMKDFDQAIEEANDTEYGLAAGVFNEDQAEIDTFFDRTETGVVNANHKGDATTGAFPGCQSFADWNSSASTDKGGRGPYGVQQLMREQSQTIVVSDDEPDDEAGE
jgi:1-pyrroline-5-carboxylate dehydrogenase